MKPSFKSKLNYIVRKPLPIIKETVLFKSFGGQYNDNPKYVSEKLHEIAPNVQIVWVISDKSKCDDIPDYVKRISIESNDYVKYASRSQVVIDNMDGIRGFVSERPNEFFRSLFKSKRQLNISTWHGTPLKKIGLDVPEMQSKKYMYTSAAYISAGCDYSKEIFEKAFYPTKIKLNGSPRNDILFSISNEKRKNIMKKLGIPLDRNVILFAPTFRNSLEESGVRQIRELDFQKLFNILTKKFGSEWCFVFRVHHEVLKMINTNKLMGQFGEGRFIDGNSHDDMAEYLSIADILLTDYSSSFFDFALTRRPCFLLTLDRKHYIDDERGIYIPIDELPYPYADSYDELYANIEKYDSEISYTAISDFLNKLGNAEDGKSSERIAQEIVDFIYSGTRQ